MRRLTIPMLMVLLVAGVAWSSGELRAETGSGETVGEGGAPMQLLIVGPPGAGKSTQSRQVKEKYGIAHISTGAILRAEVEKGSELGRQVQAVMERGELVADDIVMKLVEARLSEPDCEHGFILDGFPRTMPQANGLETILAQRSHSAFRVIALEVPDEVLLERLLSRGRADDTEEAIRKRIAAYRETTTPVIDYFRDQGLLIAVNGDQTIEEVSAEIDAKLQEIDW